MQGQHIFARCWNEQGNAGTWTAAVTENIVSKDIIRNVIEPRCNIDESLAQKFLAKHPGSNVLRVYHLPDKTVVVSRTFWEADKITDSSSRGRMGAYSFSHVLSGEDTLQFCRDYAGAFDTDCFETYDSLVNRTGAALKNPITISADYSLFKHSEALSKADVLEEIGLTKSSFIKLMSGIYYAIEKKKQFVVVLPSSVRKAWEESGSNQMELAIYKLMGLLPDFTRENFNFVAHWNDNLTNQMVNDMHLIFVHADGQEAVARLQREGFSVFEVENNNVSGDVPMTADDYFAYLWENKGNITKIEEFWSYAKSNFAKLLRIVPNSASAIQCIYLIKETIDSEYQNTKIGVKAFEMASELFAGAGKKIPAANQFLHDAISRLNITAESITLEVEKSLRSVIQRDKEPTAHQEQEYDILLSACAKDKIDSETIDILCDELMKEGRGAEPYYSRFLLVHENDSVFNSSQSMISLVVGIFHRLLCQPDYHNKNTEIQNTISAIMKRWAEELAGNPNHFAVDLVVNSFADYLSAGGKDEQMIADSYAFLFREEINAPEAISKKCADILFKEEKKIYHGKALLDGKIMLHAFYHAFSSCFQECDKRSKWVAEDFYKRLYRLMFLNDELVSEGAKEIYRTKIEESISVPPQMYAIQSCELIVLEEIIKAPAIWSTQKVANDVVEVEKINLAFDRYQLDKERIVIIAPFFDCCRLDSLEVILENLTRLSADERYQLYNQLKKNGQINILFCAAFFSNDFSLYLKEIASFVEISFSDTIDILLSNQVEGISLKSTESVQKFINWFVIEVDEKLNTVRHDSWVEYLSDCNEIVKQYETEIKLKASQHEEIVNGVCNELNCRMISLVEKAPSIELAHVSQSVLLGFSKLFENARNTIDQDNSAAKVINLLTKLDRCDCQRSTIDTESFKALCNICYNSLSSDNCQVLIERLKFLYAQHKDKPRWLEVYWVFVVLLEGKDSHFNRDRFKEYSIYRNFSDKDKIIFWIDMTRTLNAVHSEFEKIIAQTYLDERFEIFENNKKLLEDEEIIRRNVFLIKSNQNLQQLLKQQPDKRSPIDRGRRVNMEIPQISWSPLMILLCTIVGIISAFAAIGAWLLLAPTSGVSNTIIMVLGAIVALFLFISGLFIYS